MRIFSCLCFCIILIGFSAYSQDEKKYTKEIEDLHRKIIQGEFFDSTDREQGVLLLKQLEKNLRKYEQDNFISLFSQEFIEYYREAPIRDENDLVALILYTCTLTQVDEEIYGDADKFLLRLEELPKIKSIRYVYQGDFGEKGYRILLKGRLQDKTTFLLKFFLHESVRHKSLELHASHLGKAVIEEITFPLGNQ